MKLFFNLFKQGQVVANPEFWKDVQSKGQPAIAALLMTIVELLKGTPYEITMSPQMAMYIGGGIFAVTNGVLTTITSAKVGMRPSAGSVPVADPAGVPSQPDPVVQTQAATETVQQRPQTDGLMADDRNGILPQ